jgi:hypothetical protein
VANNAEEVAYCIARIAAATKSALATADSCARVSHTATVAAYRKRLIVLQIAAVALCDAR